MKTQVLVQLTLDAAEMSYVHDVLCPEPVLSPSAEDLHDNLADALAQLDTLGAAIIDHDVAAQITLTLDLLEEITPLFAKRSRDQDKTEGLDPDVGYPIAEALLDTIVRVRRTSKKPSGKEARSLTLIGDGVDALLDQFFGQN